MHSGKTGRPSQGRPGYQPFALTALALAVSMQCAQAQESGTAQAGARAEVQLPTVSVRADSVENYGPANKKSVSATKSDVPIADTPQSISVITVWERSIVCSRVMRRA